MFQENLENYRKAMGVSPPKSQVEPLSSIPVERRCSEAVA